MGVKMTLRIPIGITDSGDVLEHELGRVGHLLILGKTGTGKSVLLKSVVKSIDAAQACKIVLIDTKRFDFSGFSSPRLMCPVITDAKNAVVYLGDLANAAADVAVVIDELSDLVAVSDSVQNLLMGLSQNSHVHIIMATRMPAILSDEFKQNFCHVVSFTDGKIGDAMFNQIHIKTIS